MRNFALLEYNEEVLLGHWDILGPRCFAALSMTKLQHVRVWDIGTCEFGTLRFEPLRLLGHCEFGTWQMGWHRAEKRRLFGSFLSLREERLEQNWLERGGRMQREGWRQLGLGTLGHLATLG